MDMLLERGKFVQFLRSRPEMQIISLRSLLLNWFTYAMFSVTAQYSFLPTLSIYLSEHLAMY